MRIDAPRTKPYIEVYPAIFGSSRIWLADLITETGSKALVANMSQTSQSKARRKRLAREKAPNAQIAQGTLRTNSAWPAPIRLSNRAN
jgi:transposase